MWPVQPTCWQGVPLAAGLVVADPTAAVGIALFTDATPSAAAMPHWSQ
jgi:hypothetical protein